jgi:hypothetical protein
MPATILTHEAQQMSAIFPTKPPEGTLHFIPKNAEFISYRIGDNLVISAWMPDGFYTVETNITKTNDEFFEDYCDGCERNCSSFLDQYADEDGDINWDDIPGGHCAVYDEGYHGQHCPLGNEEEEEPFDFSVSNMVFEIHLSHLGKWGRFSRQSDSAYLCAGKLTEDNQILATDVFMASNVFGSAEDLEGICWGYNTKPSNLSEIVSQYISTPFNNDLLHIRSFYENCDSTRSAIRVNDFFPVGAGDTYLCSGKNALLLLDASKHVSAFFQMLSAGFTSLPKAPHIMILPLSETTINLGTHSISGYCTDLDAVGKSWFVSSSGEILGQMDGF